MAKPRINVRRGAAESERLQDPRILPLTPPDDTLWGDVPVAQLDRALASEAEG